MSKVAPAPASTASPLRNLEYYKSVVDKIASGDTGVKVPGEFKRTFKHRCFCVGCCSVTCCAPCLVWSALLRVLCLPLDCVSGHPCGGNRCTKFSDDSLASMCAAVNEKHESPWILQRSHARDLLAHAAAAVKKLGRSDTARAYRITDVVSRALDMDLTPASVLYAADKLRGKA